MSNPPSSSSFVSRDDDVVTLDDNNDSDRLDKEARTCYSLTVDSKALQSQRHNSRDEHFKRNDSY